MAVPIPTPEAGGALSFHIRETAAAWSGIRSTPMPACSIRGLMARRYGRRIGGKWAKDRLRDRLDQVIAHEYAEAAGISHEEAVQRAAETPLAIRENGQGKAPGDGRGREARARAAETRDGVPSLDG